MPDGSLRDVNQAIGADASGYLAEIGKIIRANREVLDSIREVRSAKIGADVDGALRDIAKVKAELAGLGDKTVTVTVKYVTTGDKPGSVGFGALGADHGEMVRHLQDISTYMDMATDSMGRMETHLGTISRSVQDSSADLMMQTQMLRDNADAHNAAAAAVTALSAATSRARGGGGSAALAAAAGAAAGGGGGGGGGALAAAAGGFAGRIFGGALPTLQIAHMATMLTMEVASQVIPAAVAAGAAAAVGYQGGVAAYQRGQGIYAAGEALGGAYGLTPGQLFGMGSGYQVAQNQATGGVYGIIGSLMRMAGQGTGQGGILGPGGMGVQTVAMIDRGLANMVGSGRAGQISQALGGGTGALQSIGDIFGNLGDTLLNLAPVLPGMGGVLFGGLKAGTGALRSVTGLAGGGGLWPLLFGTGLAAEAGYRWGGPILGGGKLPGWLGGAKFGGVAGLAERLGLGATGAAAGTEASGLAGFLAAGAGGLPIAGIAALAAASAYGISQGQFGTPAANQMGAYMRSINSSFGATSLTPITKALFQAGQTQGNLPGVSFDTVAGQQVPVGEEIGQLRRQGYSPQQALAKVQAEYAANTQNAANQLGQMANAMPATQKALSDLGVKGATLAQAADYMTMAMISPKDVGPGGKLDKTAMSQLASFVKTYSLMKSGGQTNASAILSASSADYVMASPQMKTLSQVNSAADSMTQIMTGGPAGASALFQATAAAPAHMARALGQGPFTTAGAAAWQAFTNPQTGIMAASQANMDQLRTFMTIGGLSGAQAGQLGAFELKQYMPFASQSPMALAMLQQQAMQAGVPGVTMGQSYAQTQKAISSHAGTMKQANALMTQGTQAAANIPGVADFLNPNANISPLQSALYAQMAQSAITAAQHPTRGNVSALQSALSMSGVKPGQMKVGVDAVLQNLHVPSNLIAKINAELNPGSVKSQVANLSGATAMKLKAEVTAPKVPVVPGKVTYTNEHKPLPTQHASGVVTYTSQFAHATPPVLHGIAIYGVEMAGVVGAGGTRIVGHASGFKVPGYGGGDRHLAMLEGGETVLPKEATPDPMTAALGSKYRIPGFAAGGIVAPDLLGTSTAIRISMQDLATELVQYVNTTLASAISGIHPSAVSGAGMFAGRPGPQYGAAVSVHIASVAPRVAAGGFLAGPAKPIPAAAQHVIDSFEKTFKSMGAPWGKFASEILQGLLDGIRNAPGETAKMARALVSKVTQEVTYARNVASAATQGQGFGNAGLLGTFTVPAPGSQINMHPTVGGPGYNAYVQAFASDSLPGGVNAGAQPQSVQQQMQSYLKSLQSFRKDIGTLSKDHLNKALLQQLIGAGPVQGDALAQSILGGKGGVGAVNQLWKQIGQASNALGMTAGQAVYGYGQASGKPVQVGVHTNAAAAQAQINAIHGKPVTISVKVDLSGAGGGAGGDIQLSPQQIKHLTNQIQAQLLKQAKRTGKSGLQLQGYGS